MLLSDRCLNNALALLKYFQYSGHIPDKQWVILGIISNTSILRKFAFFEQNSYPFKSYLGANHFPDIREHSKCNYSNTN